MNDDTEYDLTQAEYYMQECFDLAERALGRTSPNPIVGAIVLDKDGIPVGKGYHKKAGDKHAEVVAIEEAGDKANGGTLIVNLEPCCHQGKTPPCTDLIIKNKLKEVIFSNYDPNPMVDSKSEKLLLKNNINVISNVLEKQGLELNKFFFKWIKTKLPWVTLKQAQTLDGKIALRNNDSKWITDEEARKKVHYIRNSYDAILVGENTVSIDNPYLTVRGIENSKNPIKVILDMNLTTNPKSNVYCKDSKVLLATKKGHLKEKLNDYLKLNNEIEILELDEAEEGKLNLRQLFIELGKREILSVLVEAGPGLGSQLITSSLLDEYLLFIAPKIFGDKDAIPSFNLEILENIGTARRFKIFSHRLIGNDLMLLLRPTT